MDSNVTNLASVFISDMQGLQSVSGGAKGSVSNEKAVEFSQYMKTSVSNLAEQVQKSSGNAETTMQQETSKEVEKKVENEEYVSQKTSGMQETSVKAQDSSVKELENSEETSVGDSNVEISDKAEETIQISEDLKQSLENIKNELKQKIMDGFEITEEELEEALEVLAINIFDLLQTDELKELAVYVSGEENLISMITNDEMYAAYKEVAACAEKIGNTLMEKLSVSPEELQKVITQVKEIFGDFKIDEKISVMSENMELPKSMETSESMELPMDMEMSEGMELPKDMEISEGMEMSEGVKLPEDVIPLKDQTLSEDTAVLAEKNVPMENQPLSESENRITTEVTKEVVEPITTEVQEEVAKVVTEITKESEQVSKEQKADSGIEQQDKLSIVQEEVSAEVENSSQKQSSSDTNKQDETKEQGMTKESKDTTAVQTTTTYSTIAGDKEVQTVVQTQRTDFNGIVKQIVEQIKVQIRPDVTSMEVQLNPENLGKVNLHISSKEGAVTAQLFVQNEAVKTMIEGQLSVLRETMAQQGVKVEAVEVAVETGNFDRNLEQHSEQQRQEAQKQAKSYQHRQINLLAGIDEETMNEAEMLRTHIMRESGNSVDMDA